MNIDYGVRIQGGREDIRQLLGRVHSELLQNRLFRISQEHTAMRALELANVPTRGHYTPTAGHLLPKKTQYSS